MATSVDTELLSAEQVYDSTTGAYRPQPRVMLRLPRLYPKQAAFVFDNAPITVCFASTKSGKSSGLLIWGLSETWRNGGPEKDGYWIAPSYGVAKIMFRRMCKWLLKADPDKKIWDANDSELFIILHNGGRIWFKGGERPDMLYGPDAYWVVIDEGTRCREEVFEVATSITTKTGGPIKIIGNMKSRGQWMYKLWLRAKQGDPDISWHLLDAYDAVDGGVLKLEVIEKAKRTLPEAAFKALYLCQPDDDEGNPFGVKSIEKCVVELLSTKPSKAFGIDLAKSHDWTEVIGLDKYGYCTVHEWWQGEWSKTLTTIPTITGKKIPTLVDSTGVGDPIVEQLQKKCKNVKGYKFTSASKQRLMEGLAVAIQQNDVHFIDGRLKEQLMIFEYEYTATGVRYSAPEGMFDDAVMALALAVEQFNSGGFVLPAGKAMDGTEQFSPFGEADEE